MAKQIICINCGKRYYGTKCPNCGFIDIKTEEDRVAAEKAALEKKKREEKEAEERSAAAYRNRLMDICLWLYAICLFGTVASSVLVQLVGTIMLFVAIGFMVLTLANVGFNIFIFIRARRERLAKQAAEADAG